MHPFITFAKDQFKAFRDIILKYDVIDVVDTLDRTDPTKFWETIRLNNEEFQKAYNDAKNGKAKAAQRAIGEAVAEMHKYNDIIPIVHELSPLADSLRLFTGISDIHRESHLDFTYSRDENSYSYPGGDVYLTLGLANRLNFDFDLLLSVYAHELTHFILQHAFVEAHKAEKKQKRELLLATIVSGMDMGAAAFSDGYNASNGIYTNNVAAAQSRAESTRKQLDENVIFYRFNYGLVSDYEADIVAYRFLEWIGIGGEAYIRMLEMLQSDLEIFQNSGETHPYISDRINLLKYLGSEDYRIWNNQQKTEIDKKNAKRIAEKLHLDEENAIRFQLAYCSIQNAIRELDDSNMIIYPRMTEEEIEEVMRRRNEYDNKVLEIKNKGERKYRKLMTPRQLEKFHSLDI